MFTPCVVTIYVTNMEEALDFYCEKLGFEVTRTYTDDLVGLKGQSIGLVLCSQAQTAL